MTINSTFKDRCRLCGDEMDLGPKECHKCQTIITLIRRFSLPEIAVLIDEAAGVPHGTYKIVNSQIS